MIESKQDLQFYLLEDKKRNGIPLKMGGVRIWLYAILGSEDCCAYRYIRCMRLCEYYINCFPTAKVKIFKIYYKMKLKQLGMKYHIKIAPNTCGYGLRIMHISGGGGVLLNIKKAGNYCGFNAGVLLGNVGIQENRPTLGDHVAFGPGAKAFGNIAIGNNVFVAPNAVVTKDVPDNCVVGGVPAKIIKEKK